MREWVWEGVLGTGTNQPRSFLRWTQAEKSPPNTMGTILHRSVSPTHPGFDLNIDQPPIRVKLWGGVKTLPVTLQAAFGNLSNFEQNLMLTGKIDYRARDMYMMGINPYGYTSCLYPFDTPDAFSYMYSVCRGVCPSTRF